MDALQRAGIRTGDSLRAEARGPGEVLLVRDELDPVTQFAGALGPACTPPSELEPAARRVGLTVLDAGVAYRRARRRRRAPRGRRDRR